MKKLVKKQNGISKTLLNVQNVAKRNKLRHNKKRKWSPHICGIQNDLLQQLKSTRGGLDTNRYNTRCPY